MDDSANYRQWASTRDVHLPEEPLRWSYVHAASRQPLKGYSLWRYLEEAAEAKPDHLAVAVPGYHQELTYAQLHQQVKLCARGLMSLGVAKGDSVTVIGVEDSSPIVMFFAAAAIGAVFMMPYAFDPVDVYLKKLMFKLDTKVLLIGSSDISDADYVRGLEAACPALKDADPDHMTVPDLPHLKAVFSRHCETSCMGVRPYEQLLARAELVTEDEFHKRTNMVVSDDPFAIFTSTGTTGDPKPILHSQRSVTNVMYLWQIRRNPKNERFVLLLQNQNHEDVLVCFAMAAAVVNWRSYFTLVIAPACISEQGGTDVMVEAMAKYGCTHADLWPYLWEDILVQNYIEKYGVKTLKGGMSGAQTLSKETVDRFTKIVPEFVNMYGTTESLTLTSNFPDDPNWKRRMTSVGFPIAHTEVKIVDERGQTVPTGELGEVWIRTPLCFIGYYKDPDLTAKVKDAHGWFHTGDIARMDTEGFVYFIGRKADNLRFKRFGEVVYPGVIESAAKAHPSVAEAQCIGLYNKGEMGDDICLCILERKGYSISEAELRRHCESQLVDRDHPDYYFIMESFPRIGSRQKVPKSELKKIVADLIEKKEIAKE